MNLEVVTAMHKRKAPDHEVGPLMELVHRVASSATFEKSPRLRAFFLHVCRCAIEDKPEEATEQQIGIYVYERTPGYNPNEDNIVRSQARVLRMKLEHHFANEGKDEPTIITIPKGQYLPIFEQRMAAPMVLPHIATADRQRAHIPWRWVLAGIASLFGILALWFGYQLYEARSAGTAFHGLPSSTDSQDAQSSAAPQGDSQRFALVTDIGEVRIAAGHTGAPYVDAWGHRWDADRYYEGGVVKAGPRHFFPPVPDEGLFRTIREAVSDDSMVPQPDRGFQYNIPLAPGTYELRLYFADPLRQPDVDAKEDAQNNRQFGIDLNGHPLLANFDAIADGGGAAVDIRAFKDVHPAADGKLHLNFHTNWGRSFVSALELTPGTPGKMRPIRIAARQSDYVDSNGTHWSGDKYYIDGRTWVFRNPETGPKIPALYTSERHGNFSYAIPVPPGSYTVRLHFLESFFSPLIPAANCHGAGCRVFDVSCNGVMLLQDFDISRVASGEFQPVIKEFRGLHPNGQGKLLIAFSPKVNYAEVRAIEVIDEAK